eukprot:s36_g27.t4
MVVHFVCVFQHVIADLALPKIRSCHVSMTSSLQGRLAQHSGHVLHSKYILSAAQIMASASPMVCSRCNEPGHEARSCPKPFLKMCNFCKGVGHVDKLCPERPQPSPKKPELRRKGADEESLVSEASTKASLTRPSPEAKKPTPADALTPGKLQLSELEEREARKIEKKLREIEEKLAKRQEGGQTLHEREILKLQTKMELEDRSVMHKVRLGYGRLDLKGSVAPCMPNSLICSPLNEITEMSSSARDDEVEILNVLPHGPPRTRLRRLVRPTQSCRPAKRRHARTEDVLGDSSDEELVEVISLPTKRRHQARGSSSRQRPPAVAKARSKPSRVGNAPVRRPARRHRQAAPSESRRGPPKPKLRPKPRVARPAVVELDDEDQVIETCIPYEEAFFGYVPKSQPSALDAQWQGPATEEEAAAQAAPASELPEEPAAVLTSVAAVPAAPPEPPAPSPPLQAEDLAPQDEEQVAAHSSPADTLAAPICPELPKVELPETLELPKAAEPSPMPRPPEPPPEPKVFTPLPDIGQEETRLSEPRYSEVYVECVRNSALFDRCCVCWKSFSAGQLRLGYVPTVSLSEDPRWVHAPRCLTGDGLRVEPRSNFAAFAPSVPFEEQQRILTVLSLLRPSLPARDAEHPVLHPRLWRWGPAMSQRWLRYAVPAPGAPRVLVQAERRYTAPNPSSLSRLARTLLVQGLRRRPSDEVVARATRRIQRSSAPRREPTATSQRPRTEAPPQDEANSRGRRQWRRRSALGERAEEFFAIAPVLTLEKDVTEEEPCVICHEQLMAGDDVRRLPCCHMFHRSCIDRWMHTKAVCPLDKLTAAELIAAALGERSSTSSTGSGPTAPAGTAR